MQENRNAPLGCNQEQRGTVCIDTKRILDSCRDRDCFEDTKVLLTDFGQEMIEKASSLRVKDTKVVCSDIILDPIQFNKGFYQITVRLYTKLCIEACICLGKISKCQLNNLFHFSIL